MLKAEDILCLYSLDLRYQDSSFSAPFQTR